MRKRGGYSVSVILRHFEAFALLVFCFPSRSTYVCRDSGMKLCRMGYAKALKPGKPFAGIVLSAEATRTISAEDADLLLGNGIAGINCSWNRLYFPRIHHVTCIRLI